MNPDRPSPLWASRLQTELDRVFREIRRMTSGDPDWKGWQPKLDIVETEESVMIVIEAPGMAAEDLVVEVEGETLAIRGVKKAMLPDRRSLRFQRVERQQGNFERRVHLQWPVNSHQGRARLEGGLLVVDLPKIEDQRREPRRLEIEDRAPAGGGDDV